MTNEADPDEGQWMVSGTQDQVIDIRGATGDFMGMTGRPSSYTDEIVDIICERLAVGESLRSICDDAEMPSQTSVFRWLAAHETFRVKYASARDSQAETLFDEILNIVDDGRNDWVKRNDPENPGYVENGESLKRSQMRMDARKWMASKLLPKKYGDRIQTDHTGTVDVGIGALLMAVNGVAKGIPVDDKEKG